MSLGTLSAVEFEGLRVLFALLDRGVGMRIRDVGSVAGKAADGVMGETESGDAGEGNGEDVTVG